MSRKEPVFEAVSHASAPKLEKHILGNLSGFMHVTERSLMMLVCIGEKPGEIVKFMDERRSKRFKQSLDDLDLSYITKNGSYHQKFYFSVKKAFLGLLNGNEGSGFTPKSKARFRGLPQIRLERPRGDLTRSNRDIQIEDEQRHLIDLSGIVPRNIEEEREAIKMGKIRAEIMRQFDRKNNTDLGSTLINQLEASR